jgi:hypothetical protein
MGNEEFRATEVKRRRRVHAAVSLAEALYAGYRDYRFQTARAGRRIPILRLARR